MSSQTPACPCPHHHSSPGSSFSGCCMKRRGQVPEAPRQVLRVVELEKLAQVAGLYFKASMLRTETRYSHRNQTAVFEVQQHATAAMADAAGALATRPGEPPSACARIPASGRRSDRAGPLESRSYPAISCSSPEHEKPRGGSGIRRTTLSRAESPTGRGPRRLPRRAPTRRSGRRC